MIPARERPPIKVKKRITIRVSERLSLPRPVPTEQLEVIDCISQVRKHIGVVVTGDNDQRDVCLRQRGRHGLNGPERLGVPVLAVHKIARNDDRIHILIHSRRREISPGLSRRELSRIKSIGEPAWTTPNMDIRRTQNLK